MTGRRILILGQAKTGTTGLFFTVKQALSPAAAAYFEAAPDTIDLTAGEVIAKLLCGPNANPAPDLVRRFDRVVALLRDPRDRLISLLLFRSTRRDHLKTAAARAAFLEMLRAKEADPAAVPMMVMLRRLRDLGCPAYLHVLTSHVEDYIDYLAALPGPVLRLRYEDMVAGRLADLAAFLDLPLVAVAAPEQPFGHVLRTGRSGNWRRWLTASDVEELRPLLSPSLGKLGYDAADWALAPGPITADEGSRYVARLYEVRDAEAGAQPP